MVALFKNSFFSIAGQVERLTNVKNVLTQSLNPFSKEKPTANVDNKVLKAGLEFVAANPYTTAALLTPAVSLAGLPATGSKTVATSLVKTIAKSSAKTKVIGGVAAAATIPAAIVSPKTTTSIIKTASGLTPESIIKASASVGKTIENPTLKNIKETFTENKTLLAAAGVVTAAVIGTKAIPAAASLLSTQATKANTEAILSTSPKETMATTTPLTPTTPMYTVKDSTLAAPPVVASTTTMSSGTTKKRRKAKKKVTIPNINIRNNVLINNKTSSIGVRAYNKYLNRAIYA